MQELLIKPLIMQPLPTKSAPVSLSEDPVADLQELIEKISPDKIFLLTDEHTHEHCLPIIEDLPGLSTDRIIKITAGDDHKHLDALASVWQFLKRKRQGPTACLYISFSRANEATESCCKHLILSFSEWLTEA